MILTLQRDPATQHSTPGRLFIDDDETPQCFTLEPPPLVDPTNPGPICIQAGTYEVTLAMSPKFKRIMPLLLDVPGRTAIEIHWGDWVYDQTKHIFDTEGCIEVGEQRSGLDCILNTQAAFGLLFPKIQAAIDSGAKVWIKVLDSRPAVPLEAS